MARVSQTTQKIGEGLAPVLTEPTVDGDVVDTGAVFLMVENTTAGPVTVTVQSPITVDGLAVAEHVRVIAAGTTEFVARHGGLPRRLFGQPTGSVDAGRAYVDYDVQLGVNRAVIAF
jgi:hypothetical protein